MSCSEDLSMAISTLDGLVTDLASAAETGRTLEKLREFGFVYGAAPMSYVQEAYVPVARQMINRYSTTAVLDGASSCGVVPASYTIPASSDWVGTLTDVPYVESEVHVIGSNVVRAHGITDTPGTYLNSAGLVFVPVFLIYVGVMPSVTTESYLHSYTAGSSVSCDAVSYSNSVYTSKGIVDLGLETSVGDIKIRKGHLMFSAGTHARAMSGYGNISGAGTHISRASRDGLMMDLAVKTRR